jgi:Tat protein translocase TatB subunit
VEYNKDMGTLGGQEMLVILVLALLFFGPKELPKIARTIAKAMTEFRRAQNELKTTFSREMENLERTWRIPIITTSAGMMAIRITITIIPPTPPPMKPAHPQ